jgi:hypothetical protein
LEDLLCRLGLAIQLEQRGWLMGAAPSVVDRTLTMQGQCLFCLLARLVELTKLSVGSGQGKVDHGLING